MKEKLKIMVIVGEISGDAHAAKLVTALRKSLPDMDLEFFGATGRAMRKVGVETIVKSDDFARVGILEVATALPMFLRVFDKLKKSAIQRQPDAVILVDFPDFNLRFAKAAKKENIKTIYYISPQVWAWKKRRIEKIRKYVDLLLTILPFEKSFYAQNDFHNVEYVGNPLAGEVRSKLTKTEFCKKHDLDETKLIISLLPGSRKNEIVRILPVLIETACLMGEANKNLQFVIPLASNRNEGEVESALNQVKLDGFGLPRVLITVKNETFESIKASDVAAVASGTATLETAILGTPMAIVYNVSWLNYLVLKNFISIKYFGLINLIAEEKVCQEFIQDDFNARNLSEELFRLLEENVNNKQRERLGEIRETLGKGGAANNAATAIIKELGL